MPLSPNSLGLRPKPQMAGLSNQLMPQVMNAPQLSALLAPQTVGLGSLANYDQLGVMPAVDYSLGVSSPMQTGLTGSSLGLNTGAGGQGLQAGGLNGMNLSGIGGGLGGLGFNLPTFNAAIGGLTSLGNLAMGFKSYGLMKDQHKLTKEVTNTNLNNSITAANGALEDRLRTRAQMNGETEEQWKAEYEERKMKRG